MAKVDVKQAVRIAKDFAASIYENEKISLLGLEGVERTDDGMHWLITLGFSRPWSQAKSRKPQDLALNRDYKVFRLDAQTGDFVSMEMFR